MNGEHSAGPDRLGRCRACGPRGARTSRGSPCEPGWHRGRSGARRRRRRCARWARAPMSKTGVLEDVLVPVAEAWKKTTLSPSAMRWPRISTSAVAWRRKFHDRDTYRSISSTALAAGCGPPAGAATVGILEEGVHRSRHQVARRLVALHREEEEEQLEFELLVRSPSISTSVSVMRSWWGSMRFLAKSSDAYT